MVSTSNGSGGILPGNGEDSNIPQVVCNVPLETVPEGVPMTNQYR